MTDESIIKKTDELLEELKFSGTDINQYIESNPSSFIEINLKEFWNEKIKESGLSKFDIINKSDFSYNYFYEVISGKKIPSTDKIIRLAIAMHFNLEDCQTILKYCGYAPLYPRKKRDSVIIYAITHEHSLNQTLELMKQSGVEPLK